MVAGRGEGWLYCSSQEGCRAGWVTGLVAPPVSWAGSRRILAKRAGTVAARSFSAGLAWAETASLRIEAMVVVGSRNSAG